MENNGTSINNSGNGERLFLVNPVGDKKTLFNVEGVQDFYQFFQSPINNGQTYAWKVQDDFSPLVLWAYIANNPGVNKAFDFAVVKNEQIQWKISLTVGDFTEIGNSLYWIFPTSIIESDSLVFFECNANLDSLVILGKQCHLHNQKSALIASSFPS